MRGPLSCLNEARYGICWGAVGAGRACYESALEYAKTRVQYGRPIAGFQLTQRKLVEMMVKVQKAQLVALHLGRRKDEGTLTSARRDGGDWVLNGTKMWITNGGIADVAVVWARTDDEGVRGFLVPAGTPGFTTSDIGRKLSLRASVTSELVLEDCRLPADAVLPEVRGMRGPLSCLNEARFGIIWGSMGAARACFASALEYARTREQFDRPIGGFQLTQQKLADMLVELSKGTLLALHLGRLKDEGRLAPEQVSLGKLNNVREALAIARTARTILGANGVTLEYPVIRHANNLESVLTYEGTSEVHSLILGQAVTGLAAFT
ncbi:MAG TPA: acyl-CoA dehydrogenase [Actinomycetota bacterium]|nr:acyl-CoA dehydrogenase [Actinomycetota bacterium]